MVFGLLCWQVGKEPDDGAAAAGLQGMAEWAPL